MCFTGIRKAYTEENAACLSGVTQTDHRVQQKPSQPSASRRTCAGSLPQQLCRHRGPSAPTPSLGSPASQRPFPGGASLPRTTDPHRHLNSRPLTGGSPWQGPSLGLHLPTAAQHRACISMWAKTIAWTQLSLPQEDGARVETAEGRLS